MSEIIKVRQRLHENNDRCAAKLRQTFKASGTLVVNLVSSPGSGKTTVLENTIEYLNGRFNVAVFLGDVATEEDTLRLQESGASAYPLITAGACHFTAEFISEGTRLSGFQMPDILFLENISNLVCPASYDLGEDFKTVLLSTPEGDDKPQKYPAIFSRAAVCLMTKTDLLSHLPFSPEAAIQHIKMLNPDAMVIPMSSMDGDGFEEWCNLLEREVATKRVVKE
jgi:hydrogenase nickel incorporation protein HypB